MLIVSYLVVRLYFMFFFLVVFYFNFVGLNIVILWVVEVWFYVGIDDCGNIVILVSVDEYKINFEEFFNFWYCCFE